MKIFIYIKKNIKEITYTLLISIFFVFFVFPKIIRLNFLKQFILNTSRDNLIGISAIILFLLIFSWNKLQNYWEKVRNTSSLENPPFLPIHCIIQFIFISISLKIIFQKEYFLYLNLSKDFILFLLLNATFIVIWLISSYCLKDKKQKRSLIKNNELELIDEPIHYLAQDLLNRKKFIQDLEQEIINLPSENSAVTIGLYGSWGEGKTSVKNILKSRKTIGAARWEAEI